MLKRTQDLSMQQAVKATVKDPCNVLIIAREHNLNDEQTDYLLDLIERFTR